MRVFICLSIFCFMVATFQKKCFVDPPRPPLKHGKVVKPSICVDRYDGKTHPIWSTWTTAHCFVCECSPAGMRCCESERGGILVERCEKGKNQKSCDDEVPRLDDKCLLILPIDFSIFDIVSIFEKLRKRSE